MDDCSALSRIPDYPAIQELQSLGFGKDEPLHVLVPRSRKANKSKGIIAHSIVSDPPPGSLLRCGKTFCVTSPEMTLLQLSCKCDFVAGLMLAYEMCGCYSLRPDLESGLLMRHPLTSAKRITEFLEMANGATGVVSARRLLPYLADGSGSPRETALALICCLPKRCGGFGLPLPEMNVSLELSSGSSLLWGRKNAFDLVWPDAKIVLEYDGAAEHASDYQRDRDQRRREALAADGYAVFVLNKRRLESVSDTYAVVKAIAGRMNHRLRFEEGFRAKHAKLRAAVLS